MDLEKGQEDTKEDGQNSETKTANMSKNVFVTDYKLENM